MDLREELSEREPDKRLLVLALIALLVIIGAGVGTLALDEDDPAPSSNDSTPVVGVTPVSPTPTETGGATPTSTDDPDPTTPRTTTQGDDEPDPTTTPEPDRSSGDDSDDGDSTNSETPTTTESSAGGGDGDADGVELRTSGNAVFLDAKAVKPGDSGVESVVFENAGTEPGRLLVANLSVTDDENGLTDPEIDAGDDAAEGELSDALDIRLYATYENGSRTYFYGSATDFETLANLRADDANPGHALEAGEQATVTFDWRIPTTAGNEIQSDEAAFDIAFYLEST